MGRKTNELHHPLTVLEDAGLIVREADAFRANRTDFRINEPLLAFYHAVVRPYWPVFMRGTATDRIWAHCQRRFASAILGPHFEQICREWTLYFAADRFGEWPSQVSSGTVNDPAARSTTQVDVAAIGHGDGERAPLLVIGECKWNEVMGLGHLQRLRHVRELITKAGRFNTEATRIACFSGAGFTADLEAAATAGDVDLIGLDELYGVIRRP